MAEQPVTTAGAHIGKSVVIRGELSGSEDLYVDGQVSGTIELRGHTLTIGPNGQVGADIHAKAVILQGKLEGDILASDRVELRRSAIMVGSITSQRVSVEDGAFLKGQVDTQKDGVKPEVAAVAPRSAAAPSVPTAQPSAATPAPHVADQSAMFDPKK